MPETQVKRYTETLPEDIRRDAGRIQARHGTEFRTHAFRFSQDTAWGVRWRQAWMHPETKLWTVQEFTTKRAMPQMQAVSDLEPAEIAEGHRSILRNVCFMDALHNCAAFELAEPQFLSVLDQETEESLSGDHFRAFGEREGIPFDEQGIPHPAAFGNVLTEGSFSPAAREIAAQTKDAPLPRLETPNAIAAFFSEDRSDQTALVPVKENALPAKAFFSEIESKGAFQRGMDDTRDGVGALQKSFSYAQKHGFASLTNDVGIMSVMGPGIPAIGSSLTGAFYAAAHYAAAGGVIEVLSGTACVVAAAVTVLISMVVWSYPFSKEAEIGLPRRRFMKQMEKNRKAIEKLPEGGLKIAGQKLLQDIDMAYPILWVRQAARDVGSNQNIAFLPRRNLAKATSSLERVCRAQGMQDHEIQTLFGSLRDKPDDQKQEKEISGKLRQRLDQFQSILRRVAEAPSMKEAQDILSKTPKVLEYKGPK